ncbi:MAG: putative oxidoreductase, short-chain dehydrogenase/reductase family protein [Parachlamydiales bacterium]|nr:putative oxidoreductase, short-chain dehydrogenase/reductase family protein [Parachlamydiales bacterium]
MKRDIVIITGGSNGIGKATIEALVKRGCYIIYNLDLEAPLRAAHADGIWLQCDVSIAKQVDDAVRQIAERHKVIDCLFANAGVHHVSTIEEISEADIDRLIRTNLVGMINTLRAVLPIMRKQLNGNIVLMGSDQSLVGKSESAIYGATKAAIASLTKSTAIDYGKYNIRINCVCPGPVDTRIYRNALAQCVTRMDMTEEDVFKLSCSKQSLQRIGKPEEIAEVVALYCDQLFDLPAIL